MHGIEWNSLRFVLALAEAGSFAGAGRALQVNHVTVMRQIKALENDLGLRLFERSQDGYVPTVAGQEIVDYARQVRDGFTDLTRRLQGIDRKLSGPVRITTTDTLFEAVLSRQLAALRQEYPEITLSVDLSGAFLDLGKGEADIAIRPSSEPPDTLVGRKVAEFAHAVYAAAPLAEAWAQDPMAAPWVGLAADLAHLQSARWLAERRPVADVRVTVSSLKGLQHAVAAGMGLGVMPCYMGDPDPRLVRVGRPLDGLFTDVWILMHRDLRSLPRIKAITQFLAAGFKANEALFRPPGPYREASTSLARTS